MAARGESRQDVELSRPQADGREVSAVRSTDFPRGPRGIVKGAAAAPLSRSHAVKKLYSVDLKVNGTVPLDLYK
ncbi:hypothetical protein CP994_08485 [Enterobacter hormaechei]|nr:hypothetical protein CP994_08485 [Enterobacter hormaechei]